MDSFFVIFQVMEKVFVTGADGMLGSSICREALKQGYQVKAMCLPGRNTGTLDELPIERIYGNVLDRDFLEANMTDCTYVIHVAALTNVWPRRIEHVRQVNVEGTRNVMELVERLGMVRMVHIGSASSFAPGTLENPGDETSEYVGARFGMDYIDSKYEAQELLLKKFRETGFPVIVVCPTFMIGPYDAGPSSGQMLLGLYNGVIPGYGNGGKNFVCATDVAVAAVHALKKGSLGECYIAGGENLSYKEFFERACRVMNKPFRLRKIPHFFILSAGLLNSVAARISGRMPKLSYGMAVIAGVNQYFSPRKAQVELDMPQTKIETGIEDCVTWFRQHGYLK